MKKILFSLVALMCAMSMNAQVMKVMKGNTVVATYTADQADNVEFELVNVSSITLDQETASVEIGSSITLTATVAPENATYKTVAWSSSNTDVATVSDAGLVTAVAVGNATITATAADGSGVTGTCEVTVTPETPKTGTAKATIGGSEVDVNWVQLWADGPKFADRNVEGTMNFTDATKTGADYVWGTNWCTPSKDDMDELLKAATDDGSEKVTCSYTQESGVYGFKFTGKETGYTENSMFFPALDGDNYGGFAYYWSGTASGDEGWIMHLKYQSRKIGDGWSSWWNDYSPSLDFFVRPVLKN